MRRADYRCGGQNVVAERVAEFALITAGRSILVTAMQVPLTLTDAVRFR